VDQYSANTISLQEVEKVRVASQTFDKERSELQNKIHQLLEDNITLSR
jgi:hypothetical protein